VAGIYYREFGVGEPLVFLHGGWGYEIYPFDRQITVLSASRRIVIPDRTGYGRSPRPMANTRLESDFHERAAEETRALLDTLGLERPVLWGHSDGAVIAALVALASPDRVRGVILEAMHVSGRKPASRGFFEQTLSHPDSVGERVASVLARDHGDGWRQVISRHSAAWLRLTDEHAPGLDGVDWGGRLGDLRVPALVIHGARDPRTEPGELDALRTALRDAQVVVFPEGGHSPHSERATADRVTAIGARFLAGLENQ
jgi:pimeloyl-ACP methyl ester carboxylesterase